MGFTKTRIKSFSHARKHVEWLPLDSRLFFPGESRPQLLEAAPDLEDTPLAHFRLRGVFLTTKELHGESPDKILGEQKGFVYADDHKMRGDYPLAAVRLPVNAVRASEEGTQDGEQGRERTHVEHMQVVSLHGLVGYDVLESPEATEFCLQAAAQGIYVVTHGRYEEEAVRVLPLVQALERVNS